MDLTASSTLARAKVTDGKISEVRIIPPGASYTAAPTAHLQIPNNTQDAPEVSIGDGVLNLLICSQEELVDNFIQQLTIQVMNKILLVCHLLKIHMLTHC